MAALGLAMRVSLHTTCCLTLSRPPAPSLSERFILSEDQWSIYKLDSAYHCYVPAGTRNPVIVHRAAPEEATQTRKREHSPFTERDPRSTKKPRPDSASDIHEPSSAHTSTSVEQQPQVLGAATPQVQVHREQEEQAESARVAELPEATCSRDPAISPQATEPQGEPEQEERELAQQIRAARARKLRQATRAQVVQEQVAREQAAREEAAREQAGQEQDAREQAAREQAVQEQAVQEQAARAQALQEEAAREEAARAQAVQEQAARKQAAHAQALQEQAARAQALQEETARAQAVQEQAAREQAAREQAACEQAAHEQAARKQMGEANYMHYRNPFTWQREHEAQVREAARQQAQFAGTEGWSGPQAQREDETPGDVPMDEDAPMGERVSRSKREGQRPVCLLHPPLTPSSITISGTLQAYA